MSNTSVAADDLLAKIQLNLIEKYAQPGSITQVRREQDGVTIVGFCSSQARPEVKDLLEKAALLDFPPTWEDIDDLIVGNKQIMLKQVQLGSLEWNNLEVRFKSTMPQAKIS